MESECQRAIQSSTPACLDSLQRRSSILRAHTFPTASFIRAVTTDASPTASQFNIAEPVATSDIAKTFAQNQPQISVTNVAKQTNPQSMTANPRARFAEKDMKQPGKTAKKSSSLTHHLTKSDSNGKTGSMNETVDGAPTPTTSLN